MRILHVATFPRPLSNGPSYSVPSLVLAQRDFLDSSLALNGPGRLSPNEIRDFPCRGLKEMEQEGPAVFHEPFANPDLVVFHGAFYPDYVRLSKRLLGRKIPYVIVPRGSFDQAALRRRRLKKWIAVRLLFGSFFRSCSAIHFLSLAERKNSETWGRPTFILNNGIHPPPRLVQARGGKGMTFGFLGRLDPDHKGLDLLAEACALAGKTLRRRKVKVEIHGPDEGGGIRRLERIIRKHLIGDIFSIRGEVSGAQKEKVLRGFDLFLHTSRHEGQPIAVLEAMARGIPCLVTPGTNLAGEIQGAGAGWTAASRPASIARALVSASRGVKELRRRGKKAQALSKKFTWEEVARRSLPLYRSILQKEGRGETVRSGGRGA